MLLLARLFKEVLPGVLVTVAVMDCAAAAISTGDCRTGKETFDECCCDKETALICEEEMEDYWLGFEQCRELYLTKVTTLDVVTHLRE